MNDDKQRDYIIRTAGLAKCYGHVRAVDGLDLAVAQGEVFGFLGLNGAGKTTTIRMLCGLLRPTAGRINLDGEELTWPASPRLRRLVGYLPQGVRFQEPLNVRQTIAFYCRLSETAEAPVLRRAAELGLPLERNTGRLSPGQQRKVGILLATLGEPRLLFLDEPTAGLDPVAAAALHSDLQTLVASEGVTVFLTTHNLAEAEKLCTQVGVIRRGKLLAVGSPDQLRASAGGPRAEIIGRGFGEEALARLRAHPQVARVEAQDGHLSLELRGETEMAPLVSLLVGAGAEIEEVRKGKASLEEVFLTLMQEDEA